MTDKTIKNIADEIGVSKQAVWQKIKRDSSIDLHQFTSTIGNTVYVSPEGQKIIKSMFDTVKGKTNVNNNDNVDDNELEFLRSLINNLQVEKQELHKLLDQQQQLTLHANKQIEKFQEQLQISYAEEKQSDEKSEDTAAGDEKREDKKWWQIWK
jgi:Protein of unknown function, DUF536.